MATTPTGIVYAIATAFGTAKTVTAVTNAAEASFSVTAHGFAVGAILEVTSGWTGLNKRVVRVKSQTADAFVAEGIDTSDTGLFTPGNGVGTVRAVTTWQQISTVMNPQISGGDPKEVTFKFSEEDAERTAFDGFTAVKETYEIDADQAGQPGFAALTTFTRSGADTVQRKTLKSGAVIYQSCRVFLNPVARVSQGDIMRHPVAVYANNIIPTRYAS